MEGVAGVLQRLCRRDAHLIDVLVEKREELAQSLPGAVVGRANDNEGRGEEVLHAAPFAQELRAHSGSY